VLRMFVVCGLSVCVIYAFVCFWAFGVCDWWRCYESLSDVCVFFCGLYECSSWLVFVFVFYLCLVFVVVSLR